MIRLPVEDFDSAQDSTSHIDFENSERALTLPSENRAED